MWDRAVNSLEEVAQALAAGSPSTEADLEIDIPLDEDTRLRPVWGPDGSLTVSILQRSPGLAEAELDARREDLLRLGARHRWTHSCWGAVDPEFGEALCAVAAQPVDSARLVELLVDMLSRLGSCGADRAPVPEVEPPVNGAGSLGERTLWIRI